MDNFQGRNNFIEYMLESFYYNDLRYHISYNNFLFGIFIVYELHVHGQFFIINNENNILDRLRLMCIPLGSIENKDYHIKC